MALGYNKTLQMSELGSAIEINGDDAVVVAKDITSTAWLTTGGTRAAAVANADMQAGVQFSCIEETGNVGGVLPMFEFISGLPDTEDVAAASVTLFIRAEDTVYTRRDAHPIGYPICRHRTPAAPPSASTAAAR